MSFRDAFLPVPSRTLVRGIINLKGTSLAPPPGGVRARVSVTDDGCKNDHYAPRPPSVSRVLDPPRQLAAPGPPFIIAGVSEWATGQGGFDKYLDYRCGGRGSDAWLQEAGVNGCRACGACVPSKRRGNFFLKNDDEGETEGRGRKAGDRWRER